MQPAYHKGLDEPLLRSPRNACKILNVRAISQQPVRHGRQDKGPDLLEPRSHFPQGGRQAHDGFGLPHRNDLQGVEVR